MTEPARNPLRSVVEIVVGLIIVVGLSTAADLLMVKSGVAPGLGTVWPPSLLAVALAYRCAIAVLGACTTARLAPRFPMWHAMFLGVFGFVVSLAGVVVAATRGGMGPLWYPIAVATTAIPCAWLGGQLVVAKTRGGDLF